MRWRVTLFLLGTGDFVLARRPGHTRSRPKRRPDAGLPPWCAILSRRGFISGTGAPSFESTLRKSYTDAGMSPRELAPPSIPTRYDTRTIVLHWATAVLVIVLWLS